MQKSILKDSSNMRRKPKSPEKLSPAKERKSTEIIVVQDMEEVVSEEEKSAKEGLAKYNST